MAGQCNVCRVLAHLHPDNAASGLFVDTVPDMASEVAAMMREHHVFLETTGGSSGERSSAESIVMSSFSGLAGVVFADAGLLYDRSQAQRCTGMGHMYTRIPCALKDLVFIATEQSELSSIAKLLGARLPSRSASTGESECGAVICLWLRSPRLLYKA